MRFSTSKTGRLAMVTASGAFLMGFALLNSGGAHAIGGLCNGRPASHTWLDASGQYGPAVEREAESAGVDTLGWGGAADHVMLRPRHLGASEARPAPS